MANRSSSSADPSGPIIVSAGFYAERMFDWRVLAADPATVSRMVAEQHRTLVRAECGLLELACHWADLHSGPVDPGRRRVAGEIVRLPGGDGPPTVQEFAAAEFGVQIQTTTNAAWALIGDALDLRHRLPLLWTAVRAGQVRVWKARRVAQETRRLSRDAARQVDAAIAGVIGSVSWARLENVLAARIAEADPAGEEARAAAYEAQRFVRCGRAGENGLKLLVARAAAGDVVWFMAMVDRIAEILAADGDTDLIDVRRSKAIGILARPDHALDLLRRHAVPPTAPEPSTPGPTDPDPIDPELDGHISVALDRSRPVAVPRVELVVHVSAEALVSGAGPIRMEGVGPMLLGQVRRWLSDTGCRISVRPVIDLRANLTPVDSYEIPQTMRRLTGLRIPASAFPHSAATGPKLDLDHTDPYVPAARGGPPGQTTTGNLGPLHRTEHRLKTHSAWQVGQPEPGLFIWRSPNGHHWLTTPHAGTYPLGAGSFAATIWRAAERTRLELAA